jgi:uncharacterized protein (TIGR03067 family)
MKQTLLAMLAIGVLVAADGTKDDPKKDQTTTKNPLEGTWKGVSGEFNGMAMADDEVKGMEFNVKGDQYTLKVKGEERETGTIKVDATKTPKTIDFKIASGDDKGKNQVGIFEVEKDTLKLCVAIPGQNDRPKEMSAKAGTMQILFVLKRAK